MQDPSLLEAGFLVDMVTARQLFAFHMPDMCKLGSPSNALYNRIVEPAWERHSILSVLGYNPKQEACYSGPCPPFM